VAQEMSSKPRYLDRFFSGSHLCGHYSCITQRVLNDDTPFYDVYFTAPPFVIKCLLAPRRCSYLKNNNNSARASMFILINTRPLLFAE